MTNTIKKNNIVHSTKKRAIAAFKNAFRNMRSSACVVKYSIINYVESLTVNKNKPKNAVKTDSNISDVEACDTMEYSDYIYEAKADEYDEECDTMEYSDYIYETKCDEYDTIDYDDYIHESVAI